MAMEDSIITEKCFLVLGTGRSGTRFVSQYLQACGLDIPHEKIGRHGVVAWELVAQQCLWVPRYEPKHYDKSLHVVRHPLQTISALQTITAASWDFICHNSPTCLEDPLPLRCMKHWLFWNTLCDAMTDWRIRLEQWNHDFVCDYFELHCEEPVMPRDVNSRKHDRLDPAQLALADPWIWERVCKLAEKYGYVIAD
jgi:hypothetical protein